VEDSIIETSVSVVVVGTVVFVGIVVDCVFGVVVEISVSVVLVKKVVDGIFDIVVDIIS